MKCPLMVNTREGELQVLIPYPKDCLGEECAWFVETQDRCAIKDIALSLGFISLDMTQLIEKMTTELQFRK